MPTAKIGDIDIYYEETGRGEPVLLAPPSWWPCETWKVGVVPVSQPTLSHDHLRLPRHGLQQQAEGWLHHRAIR